MYIYLFLYQSPEFAWELDLFEVKLFSPLEVYGSWEANCYGYKKLTDPQKHTRNICLHTHTHTSIHARAHTHARMNAHTHTLTHTHSHTHTLTLTHTHTLTHTSHSHTHTQNKVIPCVYSYAYFHWGHENQPYGWYEWWLSALSSIFSCSSVARQPAQSGCVCHRWHSVALVIDKKVIDTNLPCFLVRCT